MDGRTGDPEVLKVHDDMTSYSISSSFLAVLVKIVASFFGDGWYDRLHIIFTRAS